MTTPPRRQFELKCRVHREVPVKKWVCDCGSDAAIRQGQIEVLDKLEIAILEKGYYKDHHDLACRLSAWIDKEKFRINQEQKEAGE